METQLITFKTFNDIALAYNLVDLLKKHNVPYYMEELAVTFDPAFRVEDPSLKEYAVKIKNDDFERVNQLLKNDAIESINEVDKDHYLFGFTDTELMDVLAKADEWNAFDVMLAQKILAERGKNVSDQDIVNINNQRIEELKAPDPSQSLWIIIGYICAFCGGVLGIFIGWHLKSHKKTLPNGERVFSYNDNDRRHGSIIFYISIIVFAIAFMVKAAEILGSSLY